MMCRVLFLIPLASCLAFAVSRAEVEQLIQEFGPEMRLDSKERYFMDDPDAILNSGRVALQWGMVHDPDDYDTFSINGLRSAPLGSEAALPAVLRQARRDPRAGRPGFRMWLKLDDSLMAGHQARAQALVSVVDAPHDSYLDLQFWFFYPYNGPGKFYVRIGKLAQDHVRLRTAGRHYGDWEHVTLRLAPKPWRLRDVYLSRHSISKWMGGISRLHFAGQHPIIYIAAYSHAHYPAPGTHYYRRVWFKDFWIAKVTVDLEDWTDDGAEFDTWRHYRLIHSNLAGWRLTPPAWYNLAARWGQYEKLIFHYGRLYTYKEVGSGPRGPAFHRGD
jgi:Vacuolar protein sorting-associated protein 62